MPELELIPDRDLLDELTKRFELAAFIGAKTRLPTKPGELTLQFRGCLYALETLCGDLREIVRSKRLLSQQLEEWEED